jgi:hypothetical protein
VSTLAQAKAIFATNSTTAMTFTATQGLSSWKLRTSSGSEDRGGAECRRAGRQKSQVWLGLLNELEFFEFFE